MNSYFTDEELRDLSQIIGNAERRHKRRRNNPDRTEYLLLECQLKRYRSRENEKRYLDRKAHSDGERDSDILLKEICGGCNEHEHCNHHRGNHHHSRDDGEMETPFDKMEKENIDRTDKEEGENEKIRDAFQKGRMDVLMDLLDRGKLTIDFVSCFSRLTEEEIIDLLTGWRVANGMAI